MNKKKKILIFGAGSGGGDYYRRIHKTYNVIGFLDNSKARQGNIFFGKTIYSPDDIGNLVFDKIIIASDYYREILQQLKSELGVDERIIGFMDFDRSVKDNGSIAHTLETISLSLWRHLNRFSHLCWFRFFLKVKSRRGQLFLDMLWLDRIETNKIHVFRQEESAVIQGPNYIGRDVKFKEINLPEIALYRFHEGVVRSVGRSILFSGGLVVERVKTSNHDGGDYSGGQLISHGKDWAIVVTSQVEVIEKGILINGVSETNYYHWIVEVMSQLQFLRELPGEYSGFPVLISVSSQKIPSIRSYLAGFDIHHKIIFLEITKSYRVGDLLLITSPNFLIPNNKHYVSHQLGDCFSRKESIQFLRSIAYDIVKRSTQGVDTGKSRVFMARKALLRGYNQSEVMAILSSYGFISVYMEDLSFEEQIILMQGAEFVVGPTGAAWTNLIFAKSSAKALCWMAKEAGDLTCFSDLARHIGVEMDYLTYVAGTRNSREIYYASYVIDCALVRKWIEDKLGVMG